MQKLNENEKNLIKFVLNNYKNNINCIKTENKDIIETQIIMDKELATVRKIEEKLKIKT